MAADHLSQLENPELEELKDGKIDDNFPKEYLMVVYGEYPWFADIVNFLVTRYLVKCLRNQQKDNFFSISSTTNGTSHTFLEVEPRTLLEDVFLARRKDIY